MLQKYHFEITQQALDTTFTETALLRIIAANLYQDRIAGQIGHDEYHFDNNAFEKSYAYIEEQRGLVISSLQVDDVPAAWAAFGRLTHTAQDFYAHSNYIDLWLSIQPDGALPTTSEVDPVDMDLVNSPALRSGRIYPLELLTFIPWLKKTVLDILPRDAHGWMNLDHPGRGPNFTFAFHAAVKRTRIEFEKTTAGLSGELIGKFTGR